MPRFHLIGLLLILLTALPAQAAPMDCRNPAWRNLFPLTREIGFTDCDELFSIPYAPPEGPPITIRAVRESGLGVLQMPAGMPWDVGSRTGLGVPYQPGFADSLEAAVQTTLDHLSALGPFRLNTITFLLTPDSAAGVAYNPAIAATWTTATAAGDECLIAAYLLSPGASPEYALHLIAHEIFHCIQQANLSAVQWGRASHRYADWWVEGSAETFADFVSLNRDYSSAMGISFDQSVSTSTPLYDMSYEASVFLRWYVLHRGGMVSLLPFLHQMAETADDAAQIAAMGAALPQEDWMRFATDYADHSLTDFAGRPVAMGEETTWGYDISSDWSEVFEARPFIFSQTELSFDCGIWDLFPSTEGIYRVKALDDPGTDSPSWGRFPSRIDTVTRTDPQFLRLVIFASSPAPDHLTFGVHKVQGCEPCGPVKAQDACLIGTWKLTSGGMVEAMRARHLPVRNITTDPFVFQLQRGGTFSLGQTYASGETTAPDLPITGQAILAPVTGRWTTAEGQLYICMNARPSAGEVTLQSQGRSGNFLLGPRDAKVIHMAYTCAGRAMSTVLTVPRFGDVPSGYTRVRRTP